MLRAVQPGVCPHTQEAYSIRYHCTRLQHKSLLTKDALMIRWNQAEWMLVRFLHSDILCALTTRLQLYQALHTSGLIYVYELHVVTFESIVTIVQHSIVSQCSRIKVHMLQRVGAC